MEMTSEKTLFFSCHLKWMGLLVIVVIVVLADSNHVEVLNPTLLHFGSFDRQIVIDVPDNADCLDGFNVHLQKFKVTDPSGPEEVAKKLSARTPGLAGADLASICNEAALFSARLKEASVDITEFESSIDRVLGGFEKKIIMTMFMVIR